MKRFTGLLLVAALGLSVLAGCTTSTDTEVQSEITSAVSEVSTDSEEPTTTEEATTIRVGALSGPTAMGMVKLMSDSDAGTTENTYEFAALQTDASAFVTDMVQGNLDIAAVPSNLAANIYNKTEGGVQVIAVNVYGVLSIVERGDSISSISDLKGKTIYATGQGAIPEVTLRYLLSENGMDLDTDLTVTWCSDTTEALSYITSDENAIAMLPQPFVTAAKAQVSDLNVALDLSEEWAKVCDTNIVTGVLLVRTEFAEAYPEQLAKFLEEYEASVDYTLENTADAATLIESYGIVGKAAIAEKALPNCNICCLTGSEMKTTLSAFLQVIYDFNPQLVGGTLPGDDFYYEP